MKKTLIALAVLGAAAGVAHAQSNVTIYGVVDTGYIKETGKDLRMGENVNSRIGFRGAEDLGGGLKAIFQLEKRFNVHDGTNNSGDGSANKDWEGAANVGLAGDSWGKIRFGRINELTTETIRKFDPFYQYGIGGMVESAQRSARIDNTARYDSPKWAGFNFGLSYSLGRDTEKDYPGIKYDNDGYAINLSYDNGPFMATANWSRIADSNDSDVWNIGLAYKFGAARVMALYESTKNEGYKGGNRSEEYLNVTYGQETKYEQDVMLLGLEWDIGPGQLDVSVQRAEFDDIKSAGTKQKDGDLMKYAIGYTYNLSKRTAVYGQVAYVDRDKEIEDLDISQAGVQGRESTTGVQIGMTHKF